MTAVIPEAIIGQNATGTTITLTAGGGTPPYTWSLASGSLPYGFTLDPSGSLRGFPTAEDSTSFTLRVQDSAGQTATRDLTMRVVQALRVLYDPVPATQRQASYSHTFRVVGGVPPYQWSHVQSTGALPPGLSLSSNGVLSGTVSPSATIGSYYFGLRVTDSGTSGQSANPFFTVQVVDRLTMMSSSDTLPQATVGQPFRWNIWAAGGTAPLTWSTAGPLPPGMSLNYSTGEFSGTPTAANSYIFRVQVSDSSSPPQTVSGDIVFIVSEQFSFLTTTLPDGATERHENVLISFRGGFKPYSTRVTSGSLPPGLNIVVFDPLQAAAQLYGTPTQVGTFAFTLEVRDSSTPPLVISQALSMRINPLLKITNYPPGNVLPMGLEGTPYSFTLTAC